MNTTSTPPLLAEQHGLRFGFAVASLVVTLLLAGLLHAGVPVSEALVLLVVVLSARGLPATYGVAVGLVGWAFLTGFAVHRYGVLTFTDADLLRLGGLVLAAVVTVEVTRHRVRRPRAVVTARQVAGTVAQVAR